MKRIVRLAREQGITLDPLLLVDYPIGTWFWAIHHEVVAEQLTEPLANRIECILTHKNASERKVRLAALRPVKNPESIATAEKAYAKATAPAWKAYDEAFASAQKAYYEAIAPAQKAYNEAIAAASYSEATTAAWKAYAKATAAAGKARDEAVIPAWKAYNEATAAVWKAYNEAITPQWTAEYPDHPARDSEGLIFPNAQT